MNQLLRFGFAFGAAFFALGDAVTGRFSVGSVFERNGSTAVGVFSLFDGWNQSVFAVVAPISDWEANGSTVWNGSTSIVGEEEEVAAVGTTGNEDERSEDWLFKSLEDVLVLNWSKLADNNEASKRRITSIRDWFIQRNTYRIQ